MTAIATTRPTQSTARNAAVVARWMLSFLGFPLGGLTASVMVGPVDSTIAAIAGGAVTGVFLGALQSFASPVLPRAPWIAATTVGLSVGLSVGLAVGATTVDFDTSLGALAAQGAISGAAIGVAQAAVLARYTELSWWRSASWAPFLGACWVLGWAVTTSAGVDVERQYTVFGATGAIVVTALTSVLPLAIRRR